MGDGSKQASDTLFQMEQELETLRTETEQYLIALNAKDREIERLTNALQYYALNSAWTDVVLDSYSGESWIFDWPGDLADEPWEIAEQALEANYAD